MQNLYANYAKLLDIYKNIVVYLVYELRNVPQ